MREEKDHEKKIKRKNSTKKNVPNVVDTRPVQELVLVGDIRDSNIL